MSGGSTVERIDAVDAFARTLYLRAKQSGFAFEDVASAVRQLHLTLRHLRVEAADPDSLLNNHSHQSSPVYSRQLQPMLEDCDFTLAQLESTLDKFGDGQPSGDARARDDRLSVIHSRIMTDKANVDMFLDAVQLHHPDNEPQPVVDEGQPGLEDIKDKVDQIAKKICNKRNSTDFTNDEDGLWLEFRSELEKEGFDPQVLRKHKDILRAYIRELESVSNMSGGNFPTVRGLLEREAKSQPTSPQELPGYTEDKYFVGIRDGRNVDTRQAKQVLSSSPQETTSDSGDSMAVISTRDLMALDNGMAGLSLHPPGHRQYGISPPDRGHRYSSSHAGPELSSSPNSHILGSSPRSMPPMPAYANGGYGSSPRSYSRLAPDRYGQDIPSDAQWTKIRRTLVSPEVLERAGVRYEARPEYVAVLGRLSRGQITEFARQSAEARAARAARRPTVRRYRRRVHHRDDSKSSRDDDENAVSDSSESSDSDSDGKGKKSYPIIIEPPEEKNKTSPSSTVMPKPILKNRNENHVRFDPEPYEVDPRASSYRERERDRDRDHHREHRHRDDSSRHRKDSSRRRYSDSNGDRRRERSDDYYASGRRHHRSDRSDRRDSKRDDRDRDRDRAPRKKGWGEALGAVGIGGAAAGLLGVLAEAAAAV